MSNLQSVAVRNKRSLPTRDLRCSRQKRKNQQRLVYDKLPEVDKMGWLTFFRYKWQKQLCCAPCRLLVVAVYAFIGFVCFFLTYLLHFAVSGVLMQYLATLKHAQKHLSMSQHSSSNNLRKLRESRGCLRRRRMQSWKTVSNLFCNRIAREGSTLTSITA